MRILAIDYGDAHTGVALSDLTRQLVGRTTVINSRKQEVVAEEIAKIVKAENVTEIVLGFPKNMDGTDSKRAELYLDFAKLVEQTSGIAPHMWDERRTTIDAHRILQDAGKNAKKRKKVVDAVAASLILEGYISSIRLKGI